MTTYASGTKVTSDKTRMDIERVLSRFGASAFMYGWHGRQAVVAFEAHQRQIRFHLPMPDRQSKEFTRTPTGLTRSAKAAADAHDQAVRSRWRALLLIIKAKLAAVEAGITTFEDEFATRIVLPNGQVVRDHLLPAIDEAYETGEVQPLIRSEQLALPAGSGLRGDDETR